MLFLSWSGIAGMKEGSSKIQTISANDFEPARLIANANIFLIEWNRATINHVLAKNPEKMTHYAKVILAKKEQLLDRLAKLKKRPLSKKGMEALSKVDLSFALVLPIQISAVGLSRNNKPEVAQTLIRTKLRPLVDEMDKQMTTFLNLQENQLNRSVLNMYDQFNATTWRILIINGVTIFLMFIAGVFFVQNISRPIISLSKAANDISVGKYSGKNIPSKMRDDEIGILNKSFIKMAENIRQHNLEREHLIKKIAQLNDDLSGRIIELNHANKDMDSFTYSVAHDLREPLRSINGFGKLILKNHADKLDEKGMDYFNRMSSSAQKMGNLIEALLALSRQTRKISQAVSIDLTAMTHEILAGLVDHPLPYGMKIIVADGMRLNGDKELIKVVLTNLLSNALKYTSKRTDVVIEVGVQIQEGKTVYFIRDNGVGFESEYSNKLFLPFQRLHSTQDYEGAGIGLATVERIIDRHGGRVWAEGAVDQGATFYFSI